MLLDHKSLEPFEPLIQELVDSAIGDALRGLAAAGFRPGDEGKGKIVDMLAADADVVVSFQGGNTRRGIVAALAYAIINTGGVALP